MVDDHVAKGLDVYFGVAARRTDANGTLANCCTMAALFSDIDYKDFAGHEAAASWPRFRSHRASSSPVAAAFSATGASSSRWICRTAARPTPGGCFGRCPVRPAVI